jgi:hypothetical protein
MIKIELKEYRSLTRSTLPRGGAGGQQVCGSQSMSGGQVTAQSLSWDQDKCVLNAWQK